MKKILALIAATLSLQASAQNTIYFLPNGSSIVVPSFRTYVASGYVPSEKNVAFLKELKEKSPSIKLLKFDVTKNNAYRLFCRASWPVYGPNKTPFASLIEAAVNMELVESGIATQDAQYVQAILDEFDFSSFGTGKWIIGITVSAEGKEPLKVRHEYTYPVSAGAAAGCNDVMNSLIPGIEAFLLSLYSEPRFIESVQ